MKKNKIFSTHEMSDKEILNNISEIIENEIKIDNIKAKRKEIEIPLELDEKILAYAKKADEELMLVENRKKCLRVLRAVAAIIICTIGITVLETGTSEALRLRVVNLLYSNKTRSVSVEVNAENTIMNSWSDFWYPSYVPKKMAIEHFDESRHYIKYSSEVNKNYFSIEEVIIDSNITYDTETTEGKLVEVGDTDGYYTEDNIYKNYGLLINMSDRYVVIHCFGNWSEKEVMKIAEHLIYIK